MGPRQKRSPRAWRARETVVKLKRTPIAQPTLRRQRGKQPSSVTTVGHVPQRLRSRLIRGRITSPPAEAGCVKRSFMLASQPLSMTQINSAITLVSFPREVGENAQFGEETEKRPHFLLSKHPSCNLQACDIPTQLKSHHVRRRISVRPLGDLTTRPRGEAWAGNDRSWISRLHGSLTGTGPRCQMQAH